MSVVSDTPLSYSTTTSTTIPDVKQVVKESISETAITEKHKVFIPNLNTGSTSVKIPSLNDIGKASATPDEEEDPYIKGDDREEFTYDDFLKYWNEYAGKLKAEGKKNLLSIFIADAPIMIKPNHFEVVVGNKVQENLFRDEKPNILNFLRGSLKNYDLEVNTRIDEQINIKRPYTNPEKFQHMVTKNPQLAELKKRFNLDFD